MTVSYVLLRHYRDNVLDPAQEYELEWAAFVDWLIGQGHEIRGEEGEPEEDFKLGFRGASRPTTWLPVEVGWDRPLGGEEADWDFRARHGDDTENRRRCNAAVSRSPAWVVLDIDTQTVDEWAQLCSTLEDEELDAVAYSTYSHGKDPRTVKVRLVVRASRAYPAEEIRRVRRGAGKVLGTTIDPSCVDPARLFFLPAVAPPRVSEAFFRKWEGGKALDVDAVLKDTPETASEAARRVEIQLGVWDGRPADEDDKLRAEIELCSWCDDIQIQAGGNYRRFTEQATFKFGGYIAAGALELENVRRRMYAAYDDALHRNEDDRTTAYRRKQIDTGLTQGARRPRLPFTEEQEKQIEEAVDKAAYEVLMAQLTSQRPAREVGLEEARALSWSFLDKPRYDAMHVDASTVGVGKAQPNSEPVLLERGWVPMGEVRAGDRVFGSDGELHEVLAVHPQGRRRIVKLTFSDGSSVRCDEDHLWTLKYDGKIFTKSAKEWAMKKLRRKCGLHAANRLFGLMARAVVRPEADLPVDPYTLGALLGDGCLTQNAVTFTSMDAEIPARFALPAGVECRDLGRKPDQRAHAYQISTSRRGPGVNPLINALRDLGVMGKGAHKKAVPDLYKRGSARQRLEVLRGLFDTDGSATANGGCDFCSASETLVADVAELVESLGGTASRSVRYVSYRGERRPYHRVHCLLPIQANPFHLERKAKIVASATRQHLPTRAVISIEEAGLEDATCITVSAADHLYLTKHHIPTHNSFVLARVAAKRARSGLLTVIQTQEHAVGAQTREELHRRDPGVRSVHLYSAASPPPSAPPEHKCPRLAEEPELSELIYDFDTPLRKICGSACERKDTCPALAAAVERGKALREAQVVFVSQAGVGQVRDWLEDGALLATDEQPPPLRQITIAAEDVAELHGAEHILGLSLEWTERIAKLVEDVLDGEDPDEWQCVDDFPISIEGIRALKDPKDRQRLRAAARFYTLCQRRKIKVLPSGAVEGFLVTEAHQAMLDARESVLVDATPLLAALPRGMELHRQHVADPPGVAITRHMIYRAKAGSSALYGEDWVNERVVEAAVNRALDAHPGEWLFVTFKKVREWLEARPGLLRRRMHLAHFGAVRGKNAWKGVDGIYCLGTPRFDRESMLQALLGRDFVDTEWVYLASAELEQAFGRGRHVSRTKPLLMVCEGSLAPLSWHDRNCKIVQRHEDP